MIRFALRKWDENREKLVQELWKDREGGYTYRELLRKVVSAVLNEGEKEEDRYSPDKITEIDNGDYQGTLLFLIPEDTYQPGEYDYLMTYINYGSCGLCDVLIHYNDMEYEEEEGKARPGERVKGYLSVCRMLLCNMIKPYNTGWREQKDFEAVSWEQTKEEKAADDKVVEEAQARYEEGTLDEEWDKEYDSGPWAGKLWKGVSREAGRPRFARSVRSLLTGGHERERMFQKILEEVIPGREDFVTRSGKKPFSGEYELKVPAGQEHGLEERGESPSRIREQRELMSLTFDYLSRAWLMERRSRKNVGMIDMEDMRLCHIPLIVQAREETVRGIELVGRFRGKEKRKEVEERCRRSLENLFLFTGEDVPGEEEQEKLSKLLDSCFFLARLKRIGLAGRVTQEDLSRLLEEGEETIKTEEGLEILRLLDQHTENFPPEVVEYERMILDFEANTGMRRYTGSLEEGGAFVSGDTLYVCSLAETSRWDRRETARLLVFYLLNLCCLGESMADKDKGLCVPRPEGRGYRERIIRKIGILRVRFGEAEICDLSKLDQKGLLLAAAKLACWNGSSLPEEIWKSFLIGKRIYTSSLIRRLRRLPFTVKRDILRVMGDTGASMGMFSYKTRQEEEGTEGYEEKGLQLKAEISGMCRCGQGEESLWVHASRWRREVNMEDAVYLEERYRRDSGKTFRLAVMKREELLELLTEGLPVRGVYSFKRGAEAYRGEMLGEETDVTEAERQALEKMGSQLSFLHGRLDFIEELIIADGFFEPGEIRQAHRNQAGLGRELSVDYQTSPYILFRDEKKAVMARECLENEDYIIPVLKLYEDQKKFEEQRKLSESEARGGRRRLFTKE